MVAISANSTYLSKLGDTMREKRVASIEVMLSGFGIKDRAHSSVQFRDEFGNTVDTSFLQSPVSTESALTNHDILEMYMASAVRLSNKRVKAAHFSINPRDWSVRRVAEAHLSEKE